MKASFPFLIFASRLLVALSSCSNNSTYTYAGDSESTTCLEIRLDEQRRQTACTDEEVRENCPQTCGICCSDSSSYTFRNQFGEEKDCVWLGSKDFHGYLYCDDYQNGRMVKDACPVACNFCQPYVSEDEIPAYLLNLTLPTLSPTISPAPTVTCINDDEFKYLEKHSCQEIKSNEINRQNFCQVEEVRSSCPMVCGDCCVDDESYLFTTDAGSVRNCALINESVRDQARFCDRHKNGTSVSKACPSSCNSCMSKVHLREVENVDDDDDVDDDGRLGGAAGATDGEGQQTVGKNYNYLIISLTFVSVGVILGATHFVLKRKEAKRKAARRTRKGTKRKMVEGENVQKGKDQEVESTLGSDTKKEIEEIP
mmetsp:Transcript_20140/g.24827  ORF Transcript_20140/g.24827 Transcript_20140/m.24827 type:complete len:369 (-) Transcript_20140:180-1286(-)